MTMSLNSDYLSSHLISTVKSNIVIDPLHLEHSNINAKDKKGRNALYFAIESKNSKNVKLLVENGISLVVAPRVHALFHAISCNDCESMVFLLSKGIDINIRDREYKTPLMYAVYYSKMEIFNHLIHNGADLFAMDQNHDMAIDFASRVQAVTYIKDILHWRMMFEESKKV